MRKISKKSRQLFVLMLVSKNITFHFYRFSAFFVSWSKQMLGMSSPVGEPFVVQCVQCACLRISAWSRPNKTSRFRKSWKSSLSSWKTEPLWRSPKRQSTPSCVCPSAFMFTRVVTTPQTSEACTKVRLRVISAKDLTAICACRH